MTPRVPEDIQTPMLLAVDAFDEAHQKTSYGTDRDYEVDTAKFWDAFSAWAPYALVGTFNMDIDKNGNVAIMFSPNL